MATFQVLAALFALYMLARYAPAALRALDRRGADRSGAILPLLNVAIAIAILVVAVKGIAGRLISR
jgi:small neutral amino acid transporter SnatA (MarC family)